MKKIIFFRTTFFLFSMIFYLISCSKDETNKILGIEKVKRTEVLSKIKALSLYKFNNNKYERIKDYIGSEEDTKLQEDLSKQNQILELINKVIPLKYRSLVNEILIFNDLDIGGYAHPLKEDLSSFQIGISIHFLEDNVFSIKEIIIHEFGHVLTLNNSQFILGVNECNTFKINIPKTGFVTGIPVKACSKENSYINNFDKNYWKDIKDEFNELRRLRKINDPTYFEKQSEFTIKYQDHFVSDYATTAFEEDIAEVFLYFIVRKKPNRGDKIKDKKVLSMYNSKELISVRNFINDNLEFKATRIKPFNKSNLKSKYCLNNH